MKPFAADLKSIYLAPTEAIGHENMLEVKARWDDKYPGAMKRWEDNWDVISPIFKFSTDVRKVIYTTNAIESLNSTYKKLNRQRSYQPRLVASFLYPEMEIAFHRTCRCEFR